MLDTLKGEATSKGRAQNRGADAEGTEHWREKQDTRQVSCPTEGCLPRVTSFTHACDSA